VAPGRSGLPDVHVYRAPWLLVRHAGRATLRRCGRRHGIDLGPTRSATDLVLTARHAAWIRDRHTVMVRRLRDGATFRYTIPGPFPPRLTGTDRRLWIASRNQYLVEL
jgi:hypothetical protein